MVYFKRDKDRKTRTGERWMDSGHWVVHTYPSFCLRIFCAYLKI